MTWTPEALALSGELAEALGQTPAAKDNRRSEIMPDRSEINVFTIDDNGYKTHWKVVEGTTGEELTKLTTRQLELTQWLAGHHFTPDDFGRGPSNGGRSPNAAGSASGGRSAPAKTVTPIKRAPDICDLCGGGDISAAERRTDKSPDWRCDACDGAAWGPKKDGTYTWRESTK